MKKFFSCLLLCALLCVLPAHAAYSDVPEGEWYQPYVTELSAQGVISGYEDGTFRPDGTVTWGEALKLILLAAGQDSQPATDVHWAGGYLNLALQWGILPVGPHYDLDAPITRQQVAQIAARALGLRAVMAHNPFADCSDPEVLALCEAGIVEGMEVNGQMCFVGEGKLLRSQISAIIFRIHQWVGREEAPEHDPTEEEPPVEEPILPELPETGGLLGPGSSVQLPEPEAPRPQPPKQITYNSYTVDVLEDVPVFAYDPNSFSLQNGRMTCADPSLRLVHGIDVSSHQGLIDWNKVAGDGVEFTILRAAYRGYTAGSLNKDSTFDYNAQQAAQNGLQVGAYIFSQAITVEEAVQEADFLLEILAGKPIDGPVVFDWEVIGTKDARTYGLDTDTLCAAANAFCRRIEQAGYSPMIYFNSYAGYVKYDLSRILEYPFWFAQYKEKPDFYYNFQMWQYTSSGKVNGIDGNVDLDVWMLPNS